MAVDLSQGYNQQNIDALTQQYNQTLDPYYSRAGAQIANTMGGRGTLYGTPGSNNLQLLQGQRMADIGKYVGGLQQQGLQQAYQRPFDIAALTGQFNGAPTLQEQQLTQQGQQFGQTLQEQIAARQQQQSQFGQNLTQQGTQFGQNLAEQIAQRQQQGTQFGQQLAQNQQQWANMNPYQQALSDKTNLEQNYGAIKDLLSALQSSGALGAGKDWLTKLLGG